MSIVWSVACPALTLARMVFETSAVAALELLESHCCPARTSTFDPVGALDGIEQLGQFRRGRVERGANEGRVLVTLTQVGLLLVVDQYVATPR